MNRVLLLMSVLMLAPSLLSQEKSVSAPPTSAPIAAPFGVKDVVDMLVAKVPEDLIVAQITKANLRFALSPQDLIALTKAGASERILRQLDPSMAPPKPAGTAAPNPAGPAGAEPEPSPTAVGVIRGEADPNDPNSPHKPGIYLYTEKNGERKLVEIEKTVPQNSRTKNTPVVSIVAGAYVYAFLPRAKAMVRTTDHQPVFYFYVGETSQISADVNSPMQLGLVKMEHQTMQGLEGRRMAYAKVPHAFSQPITGTDPKAFRLFKPEQTGPRAFRLIPDNALDSGEYCFFFNTGANAGWNKGAAGGQVTLWDFGID